MSAQIRRAITNWYILTTTPKTIKYAISKLQVQMDQDSTQIKQMMKDVVSTI